MIDDCQGLYAATSEAVKTGKAIGGSSAFDAVMIALGRMSVEAEKDGKDERFRSILDVSEAVKYLMMEHNYKYYPNDYKRMR